MPKLLCTLMLVFSLASAGLAQEEGPFAPAECGGAVLERVEGFPMATVRGTPEEMGKAQGILLGAEARTLIDAFLKPASMLSGGLEAMKTRAKALEGHLPDRYRRELKAFAEAAKLDYMDLFTGCAFPDVYRHGGCSTLAVFGSATKDGRPYLARNLDFFPMGVLQKYGVIARYHPAEFNAFLSVTWPGMIGVLSGMNEKGLCIAVMEVRTGKFSDLGMPSMFLFRRILEEADSVEEGLKILQKEEKVASNNLILMDKEGNAAVAEIGPKYCMIRKPEKDAIFATNDHCLGVKPAPQCRRYDALAAFVEKNRGTIDPGSLEKALNEVNQGMLSVQSMVFDPQGGALYLAMGNLPATRGPYKTLAVRWDAPPPRRTETEKDGGDAAARSEKALN